MRKNVIKKMNLLSPMILDALSSGGAEFFG